MNGTEQNRTTLSDLRGGCPQQVHPLHALQEAFKARQLLTYREGDALVCNDPYLRDRVDVTLTRQGYVWESPTGSLCYGSPGSTSQVVDDVVTQWAGIYWEG